MSLRILSYIVLLCIALPFSESKAQISLNPVGIVLKENGVEPEETKTLEAGGETYQGAAPLEIRFMANIESPSATLRYEWNFASDEEFNDPISGSPRYEEETIFDFVTSGTFYVRLQVSDTETEDGPTSISDVFIIQVPESELKIPNAFSPNGDGINDVYKAKKGFKSIVEFRAIIFNRWGQKLFEWTDPNEGWDGTFNGKPVAQGVYFVNVKAKGADGRKFHIKKVLV